MALEYIRNGIYVYIAVHALGLIFLCYHLSMIAVRMRGVLTRLDELVQEIRRGNENV